jgi:hypothetical protein
VATTLVLEWISYGVELSLNAIDFLIYLVNIRLYLFGSLP